MTTPTSPNGNNKAMAMGTFSVLFAGIIGAILGVLFAPKAGTDTRAQLANKAKQMSKRFQHTKEELADDLMPTDLETQVVAA